MEIKHKVRMLKTVRGSDETIKDGLFYKDKQYTIGESLLKPFIEDGAVELVQETKPTPVKMVIPKPQPVETKKSKKRGNKKCQEPTSTEKQ